MVPKRTRKTVKSKGSLYAKSSLIDLKGGALTAEMIEDAAYSILGYAPFDSKGIKSFYVETKQKGKQGFNRPTRVWFMDELKKL